MEGSKPGWRVTSDPPSETTSSSLDSPSGKIHKREQWSKKLDFLLACIGFSVGLGNVWRFPFLCYRNGGGAFLIPYFLAVILGGIPMFFLEVSLGQFMSEGGIGPWKIAPLFQGIGYATMVIVFLLNCEYNVILSWAFYYIFASFTRVLPWSHCDNEWNSENCTTLEELRQMKENVTSTEEPPTVQTPTAPALGIVAATLASANDTLNSTSLLGLMEDGKENVSKVILPDPVTEFWELCM